MTSPGIFFHFFKIWIFRVVSGIKGQKMTQNDKKNCLSRSISQEPYIIWLSSVVHNCKMMISQCYFFIFSKLVFPVVSRVKGQKMAQNDKKFYLSRSISQEPYIIWSSFVVHKCKMIISQGFFLFFKILIFRVVRKVKGQ